LATSLTPPERETVILLNDEDDLARISSWQRKVITKLEKNPAATKIEDWRMGTSVGAVFELPASMLSFRSVKRQGRPASEATMAALAKARERRQNVASRAC
jgi:hypothetical protein